MVINNTNDMNCCRYLVNVRKKEKKRDIYNERERERGRERERWQRWQRGEQLF